MAELNREQVLSALNTIRDPIRGEGLSDAGMVRGLIVSPERVGFMLEVPSARVNDYAAVREAAESLLAGLPGVKKAQVVLTAEIESPAPKAASAKLSEKAVDQNRPK
eukprot:gene34147-43803_t